VPDVAVILGNGNSAMSMAYRLTRRHKQTGGWAKYQKLKGAIET
jgi:hypothetical protein